MEKISSNSFISWYKANGKTTKDWYGLPVSYLEIMLKMHIIPVLNNKESDGTTTFIASFGDKYTTITIPAEIDTPDLKGQFLISAIYTILEESGVNLDDEDINDPLKFLSDDLNEQVDLMRKQIALLVLSNIELQTQLDARNTDLMNSIMNTLEENEYSEEDYLYGSTDSIDNAELAEFVARTSEMDRYDNKITNTDIENKEDFVSKFSANPNISAVEFDNFNNDMIKKSYNKDYTTAAPSNYDPNFSSAKDNSSYRFDNIVSNTVELLSLVDSLKKENEELARSNNEYKMCIEKSSDIINNIYSIIEEYFKDDLYDIIKSFEPNNTNIEIKTTTDTVQKEFRPLATIVDPTMVTRDIINREHVIFTYTTNPIKRDNKVYNISIGIVQRNANGGYEIIPLNPLNTDIIITGIYFMTPEFKILFNINDNN